MEQSYTSKQTEFLEKLESGANIFLTGKAGTGKSFIVREGQALLKKMGKKHISVAPTGIAATNIDGQTIHSMFAINPFVIMTYDDANFVSGNNREVLKKADVIIIDEVSQMRADLLDGMHYTLLKNGVKNGLKSKQLVFVGDMKQLPPIIDDNTRSKLFEIYDGVNFEYSIVYQDLNVQTIELDEIVRQSDPEFIEALNNVRDGKKDQYFKQFLSADPAGVILAPYNSTVAEYNKKGFDAQPGDVFTFKASIEGDAKIEDFNLEPLIEVKNGCKIMYLVNIRDNNLRNGTIGIFVSHKDCHYIRVGNVDYSLEKVELTKKKYVYNKSKDELELQEIGKIVQYPFKLAYALSIHKSQGLTFDECTVDLSRPCFQKEQLYVALSRVKTPQGLRIIVNR